MASGVLLVPFVTTYPEEAVAALQGWTTYGWALDVVHIGPEEHAYYEVLNDRWTICGMAGGDLLIVEGDIVVHDRTLDDFDTCPNAYCASVYWVGASYQYGLGCTRFRAELIRAHPDLLRVAGQRTNDGVPIAYSWKRMDTRLYDEAKERGLLISENPGTAHPCIHEPAVHHSHKYAMPEPGSPEAEQFEVARFREQHA